MTFESCRHGHEAPRALLIALPESQGGPGRHKCPVCAYEQGKFEIATKLTTLGDLTKCSHGSIAPTSILDSLESSQAGSGRHKCVVCAYHRGRAEARGLAPVKAWAQYDDSGYVDGLLLQGVPPDETISREALDEFGSVTRSIDNARLAEIGVAGELLVIEHEKRRLTSLGLLELSRRVIHVSQEVGDGAGYDIMSFFEDGREMYIEVKTTLAGNEQPFYITANELKFAAENSSQYCLYRLYDLDEERNSAKFFVKSGDPKAYLNLIPSIYRAKVI